ncbi:MAG TPA: [Fe-Fe] hydrogenase large subunit C-terminal domain-containing protein [Prolixibacteraceae bacterium]|nr:[Fe-Fe] hydrogenase large subunit C-terminal domain-containing protein [Prolixibacteraceae bacterium]
MFRTQKYHAIQVDRGKCIGCTHCMKVCPTEAIRVKDGIAVITGERCVDCGDCMRVCPTEAFYLLQDDLSLIGRYKYRIALFPSVLPGQFPDHVTDDQIYGALLKIGFTHLFEVEQPIQWMVEAYRNYHATHGNSTPLISAFCPAIVRLIQIRYPSLIDKIMLINAPHDLAAHFAIESLKGQGINPEDTGIFYIAPCSAKIAAVKDPVGEKKSVVDGIINMHEIYNKVMSIVTDDPGVAEGGFREHLTREGILWSLPRGEARLFKRKSMAIDGIFNVVKMLEQMETGEIPEIGFLELRACDQGCAGGIMVAGNRFLTVERLDRRSRKFPHAANHPPELPFKADVLSRLVLDPIEPAHAFQLGKDRQTAMEKMAGINKLVKKLPALDCGACGAPNCHALAEDIVRGNAALTDCIFLRFKNENQDGNTGHSTLHSLEKIWGAGRFSTQIKTDEHESF